MEFGEDLFGCSPRPIRTIHEVSTVKRTRRYTAPIAMLLAAAVAYIPTGADASPSPQSRPRGHRIANLGAFIPLQSNGIYTTPAGMLDEAQALNVHVLRAEQDITKSVTQQRLDFAAAPAGIKTVLTIRDNPVPGPLNHPTVYPPHTQQELDTFESDLRTSIMASPPALIVVENEEVGSPFVSGPEADYIGELQSALKVGHEFGIPVANGGIVSTVAVLLTWHDLFRQKNHVKADDYAMRAFPGTVSPLLQAMLDSNDGTLPLSSPWRDDFDRGQQLIADYAKQSDLDFVNFHWYVDDAKALKQTVKYLRSATGHEVISHETGQHNTDPAVVTSRLKTFDQLHVPWVIWFDADGMPAYGLHDMHMPGTLFANGVAFATSKH